MGRVSANTPATNLCPHCGCMAEVHSAVAGSPICKSCHGRLVGNRRGLCMFEGKTKVASRVGIANEREEMKCVFGHGVGWFTADGVSEKYEVSVKGTMRDTTYGMFVNAISSAGFEWNDR